MQLTLFHLQALISIIFFSFQKAQALPTASISKGPIEIVVVAHSNQTSDATREMNFPASADSFAPRTAFCGQPTESNLTQNEVSRTLVSHRTTKINALKLELQAQGLGAHAHLILTEQMKPISVAFHVLFDPDTGAGNVTDNAIAAQIQTLNQDYASTGFRYNLVNTTRTANSTLFNQGDPGSDTETDMKSLLHQGDASTLNVYSVSFANNFLGYSTWPWDYSDAETNDGVVFLYSTLPGGEAQDYNMGKTLVHEVGHWNGLYHTFQGGCDGEGDEVDDTAPEASPTSGCPTSKDTCPDNLQDPIHNYMDYSVDECLTQFTPGQAVRMSAISSHYRGL